MTLRLLIDTDAGVDDAQALLLAFRHHAAQVEAITTVTGNVHVDQVLDNVHQVLDLVDLEVPVYRGMDRPLVEPWSDASEFHGGDGLGDCLERPPPRSASAPGSAVHALLQRIDEAPGELTLVALGPLTNVAMAVRLDPELPTKLRSFVCMGGTVTAMGNASRTAEYNFFADPEAAHIVLEAFPETTLLSWEATLEHAIPWPIYDELCALPTRTAAFFAATSRHIAELMRGPLGYDQGYLVPDPLAMAIALEPELVHELDERAVSVELYGRHTRGQCVIDHRGRTGAPANVRIVRRLDRDGFVRMFHAALASA